MKIFRHSRPVAASSVMAGVTDATLKRIARLNEFDNGHVLHGDWRKMSFEKAEALARQKSAEDPDNVYYVQYDNLMDPSSDYSYKYGKRVKLANRYAVQKMSEDEIAAIECSEASASDDDIQEIDQEFTSRDTAINGIQGKLPAIFKMISIPDGAVVLDYGGGKPEAEAVAQSYLDQFNAIEALYDPFNQTSEHNQEVIKLCRSNGGADIAVCSNVLNVIKEPEVRLNVLQNIHKLVKPGGHIYITVYEGSGKGDSKPTKSGYQLNRKTSGYLEEICQVFPDAKRKGKLISATNASVSAAAYLSPANYHAALADDVSSERLYSLVDEGLAIFDKMLDHGSHELSICEISEQSEDPGFYTVAVQDHTEHRCYWAHVSPQDSAEELADQWMANIQGLSDMVTL